MNSALQSGHEKGAGEVDSTKAARTKKSGGALPAAEVAGKGSKPFSMSYGGGTAAEYVQYMIDRGAR